LPISQVSLDAMVSTCYAIELSSTKRLMFALFFYCTSFPTLYDHFDSEPQGVHSKWRYNAPGNLHYIPALFMRAYQTLAGIYLCARQFSPSVTQGLLFRWISIFVWAG